MHQHEKLNYVEFGTPNIGATKAFFAHVFGWQFVDYGPDYAAFSGQGLDGGFYSAEQVSQTSNGAALLVFYSSDIHATLEKVAKFGGQIIRPFF
uniref:VOC family protein n=1 Tax=Vibrio parahaemolyticus TaxID=670 RepID=UPI0004A2582C